MATVRGCISPASQPVENGAWYLASRYPERFAAVTVVAGHITQHRGTTSGVFYPSIAPASTADPYKAVANMVSSLPIWIFHGEADRAISVEESRQMFAALKSLGADVHYTEIPGAGHLDGIAAAYDNADLVVWMSKKSRR